MFISSLGPEIKRCLILGDFNLLLLCRPGFEYGAEECKLLVLTTTLCFEVKIVLEYVL